MKLPRLFAHYPKGEPVLLCRVSVSRGRDSRYNTYRRRTRGLGHCQFCPCRQLADRDVLRIGYYAPWQGQSRNNTAVRYLFQIG